MPSAITQRRKAADPAKGVKSEINECLREITRKRREIEKLEERLQGLLDKHLKLLDGVK